MQNILFQLSYGDERYLPLLKPVLSGKCNLYLNNSPVTAILEVAARAKEKGCQKVATTSPKLLQLLLNKVGQKLPSVDDYAGSIIERYGIEFLILNPVEQLVTVPYGRFLYERYFSKFIHAESWLSIPEFVWELYQPARHDEILKSFAQASFISIDIETSDVPQRAAITCVGFTAVHIRTDRKAFSVRTVVVPATDIYNITVIRSFCELGVPKVFQNGKYDNAYLLRYGICTRNWAFDTAHLFHSWYSELPKRLDFITSFTLRKWQYWKDEARTTDLIEYYQYNAKDAFGTAMAWLSLMNEVPEWAWKNYLMEFPLVFPCLLGEMIGVKTDLAMMQREEARMNLSLEQQLKSLQTMTACSVFNPSSPKQVMKLFTILGCKDVVDTKPASRDKVASRHPLNKRLMIALENYRKDRKLVTSYLRNTDPKGGNDKLWYGRMFFTSNPHGTDTGRLASRESAFWCGTNMTNQPRDRDDIEIKNIYMSDDGFLFGECDYEQAEARDTAYISGDTGLIAAVESPRDFHATNASKFFGVPYERLVAPDGTVIDKKLRDLSKRVNHGSNYNMGASVLLDTMGYEKVIAARNLLGLPKNYTLKQVTQHLLNTYAKTYPVVKRDYYNKVIADVTGSKFLVGATGWSRYCFSNPASSKQALNEYVAHCPQSLNAMTLNKAWMRVFFEVWLPNWKNFKMIVQIHDSILFQYRVGYEHLAWKVKSCMEMKIPVTDVFGITRELFVPVALKGGANRWSNIKSLAANQNKG